MRYFISFLVALGLLFLVIFLLFHGGKKPSGPQPPTAQTLSGYASTDAQAIMTIDGPVNSVQNHTAIRITVGNDGVTYEQLKGYSGDVVNTRQYANTQDAYTVFLLALAKSGFTKGNNNQSARDERGYCPLGNRYVFQLVQDNNQLERYWATNCGVKTYQGNLSQTVELFKLQVPDYNTLTRNVAGTF